MELPIELPGFFLFSPFLSFYSFFTPRTVKYLFYFLFKAEQRSIYLFTGSSDTSLFLEASVINNNYYELNNFEWSCVPFDPNSCPYCPSEGIKKDIVIL